MANPLFARRCLGSVALADDVRQRVIAQDAARVAALLRAGKTVREYPALAHAILDNLGPELAQRGSRIATTPTTQLALCELAERALTPREPSANWPSQPAEWAGGAALAASAFIGRVRTCLDK